jgi:hypothetical protein
MRIVFAMALLLCVSCGDSSSAAGPGLSEHDSGPVTISYAHDVLPIFQAKCIACHYSGGAIYPWNLSKPFDPETGIIHTKNMFPESKNRELVVPGKPEESFLLYKITATKLDKPIDGDVMPYLQPKLTAAEIETVRTWINNGAKEDEYHAKVAPIFGTALKLDERGGKCTWCHSASSPYTPNMVDPFDATRGLFALKAVVPGDAEGSLLFRKIGGAPLKEGEGEPMPLHYAHCTESELATIEAWIREGALNN